MSNNTTTATATVVQQPQPQVRLQPDGTPWPVIDRTEERRQQRATAPKKKFRLLAGRHVEQVQVGVDRNGIAVTEDRCYSAGDIIETTDDLCRYNGNGSPAHYKFELIREGQTEQLLELPKGAFTWDSNKETITQFLARAKQPMEVIEQQLGAE